MKSRLKYLPFNLFWCLHWGVSVFLSIWLVTDNIKISILFSIMFYIYDVKQETDRDELKDLIKESQK